MGGVFDLPRYLSVLPLFADLPAEALRRLADGCTLRRLPRGETVFRVGDPCEAFHVVVVGQVKQFALSAAGQEKVLELVGPGNSFGEALLFADRRQVVNAQTLVETTLLAVARDPVLDELARDAAFALRMLASVSRRQLTLLRDVETQALHSGMQRVIGFLMPQAPAAAAPGRGMTVSLPASKATIASRLSLTPEYFSRVLHELAAGGLIEIDRREIRIPDPRRLARQAA